MDMTMLTKFVKGLMWAVLAGYAVAIIACIVTGEYKQAFGLAMKGMVIIGLNLLRVV